MPVISKEDNRVLGIITISDLVTLYDKEVEKILKIRKGNDYTLPSVADMESSNEGFNHSQKKE
jgi:CBS domain containing-hemolysin-like protein